MILTALVVLLHACKSDDKSPTGMLTLSTTEGKVKIGDYAQTILTLEDAAVFDCIVITKSIEGKLIETYHKELNVKDLSFPYTFTEQVVDGDEKGTVVYSFYGQDATGHVVDAADLVLTIELAELPLLLKYDWILVSQTVKGEDTATPDLKDDVYRFNPDMTWELDWGTEFSAMALETLNSYCSWQVTTDGAKVKTLSTIHYNVFSPTIPTITTYNVLQLSDRKMVLESFMDLSAFGEEYSDHEQVLSTFATTSKTDDFTPYRGSNPDNYYIEACSPGSY